MARKEYVRIKYNNIPEEFRKDYNFPEYVCNGWVFFEVIHGAYGLTQLGKIVNDLLRQRLNNTGSQDINNAGAVVHTWRPIQSVLIVDNFGLKYVGKQNADNLLSILNKFYKMSEDWEGIFLRGSTSPVIMPRNSDRTCSMDGYIRDLLFQEGHTPSSKPHYSPHKHRDIIYGAK